MSILPKLIYKYLLKRLQYIFGIGKLILMYMRENKTSNSSPNNSKKEQEETYQSSKANIK